MLSVTGTLFTSTALPWKERTDSSPFPSPALAGLISLNGFLKKPAYSDSVYEMYNFPARYKNQIHEGDTQKNRQALMLNAYRICGGDSWTRTNGHNSQ